MKINISKKVKLIIKIVFILVVLGVVVKEFGGIINKFNGDTFSMHAGKLTIENRIIIVILGLIAFVPLTLYDVVLKKNMDINLKNKKLYKYSWIASSIASLVGFGGTTAIALKSKFYGRHVKDKSLLIKEVSKNVVLNLTGFCMISLMYTIINKTNLINSNLTDKAIFLIGMGFPVLIIYIIYKYFKNRNKHEVIYTIKIMIISIIEWATTVMLIYGILFILGANISLFDLFPIFVSAVVVAMISMVPGGIGTFDLTLLIGLEKFNVPGEIVLLAIVLYRISYYLIPVVIGAILYIHEVYVLVMT